MVHRLIILALVALGLFAILTYVKNLPSPSVVSGFLEADEIRVGSRVGGRVAQVHVSEGQAVRVGQVLVELEPFDLEHRRAEVASLLDQRKATLLRLTSGYRLQEVAAARARVDQAAAHLQRLQNGPRSQEIEAAKAQFDQAHAELAQAKQNHERVQKLFERNAVTRDTLEQAMTDLQAAQARFRVREEELQLLQAGTRAEDVVVAQSQVAEVEALWKLLESGFRPEEIAEAEAGVRGVEAALCTLNQQIAELKIVSPVDGSVEAVDLQPGDLIAANAPALSLVDTRAIWVRAYVPANRVSLHVGQQVSVRVDSYPGERFNGRISYIARRAEFTPSNVQTLEERSKQVFRVKVDLLEGLDRLRPGMSADLWLEERSLP